MLEIDNLSGHVLTSFENRRSSFFSNSLMWIIKHGGSGSIGLLVNKPRVKNKGSSLRIKNDIWKTGVKIRNFGPVSRDRLRLAHARGLKGTNSMKIAEELLLSEYSTSRFTSIYSPQQILVGIGYSGTGPGQLESEFAANIWLLAPSEKKIVFDVPDNGKLIGAVNSVSIDLNLLTRNVGHD